MNPQHAVAVLIVSPEGVPLVRDPKKPVPRYWKLPGGRSEGDEIPEECAVREIREELGLKIAQDDLRVLEQQDRGTHTLTFFRIDRESLKGMRKAGDEQEEIRIFSPKELAEATDIFPNHRGIIASSIR